MNPMKKGCMFIPCRRIWQSFPCDSLFHQCIVALPTAIHIVGGKDTGDLTRFVTKPQALNQVKLISQTYSKDKLQPKRKTTLSLAYMWMLMCFSHVTLSCYGHHFEDFIPFKRWNILLIFNVNIHVYIFFFIKFIAMTLPTIAKRI